LVAESSNEIVDYVQKSYLKQVNSNNKGRALGIVAKMSAVDGEENGSARLSVRRVNSAENGSNIVNFLGTISKGGEDRDVE
jgi:hypothetical protein